MAAAALAGAVAVSGCGLGSGETADGEAKLTVTRDYGAEELIDVVLDALSESESVMRALDREAEITTRYGGGFVQSIEGIEGGTKGGRSVDWFFYVNGVESPIGAGEAGVAPGDRVWWDHHDWTDVARVPAVVGSFPQPFAAAFEETGEPIEVGCAARDPACEIAAAALAHEAIEVDVVDLADAEAGERPRLLVAEVDELAGDRTARMLLDGPEVSGIFARAGDESTGIELLDDRLQVRRDGDLGLVGATAGGDEAPTWIVTATDAELLPAAAELLGGGLLHGRFALAVDDDGKTIPVPVR